MPRNKYVKNAKISEVKFRQLLKIYSIDENASKAICRNGTPEGCIDLSILAPEYLASIPEPDSNYYYVRRSNNSIEVTHPRDNIWNIGGNPSLDLNFASNKSLIDNVSGKNLIDFSRNSIGTYVGEDGLIKTAGINEPRFDHNPTTGESLGLLLEEQRTNIIVSTQSFNSGGWNQDGVSLTANSIIAPDGTNTATSIVSGTGNNRTYHFDNTGAGNKTLTIFAKSNTGNSITLSGNLNYGINNSGAVTLNTSNGTISTATGCSSVAFSNGWYRFIIPINVGNGTGNTNYLSLQGPVDSVYIWGAQIEAGSFSTSYIRTTNTTVTRPADVATITGTNFSSWYNQNKGAIFTEFKQYLNQSGWRGIYDGGSTGSYPSLHTYSSSGSAQSWMQTYEASTALDFTIAQGTKHKTVISHLGGEGVFASIDGNNVISKLYTSNQQNATTINFNRGYYGERNNGHITRFTYWPTRLPNLTLQALTQ